LPLLAGAGVVQDGRRLGAEHGGRRIAREPYGLVQVPGGAGRARCPEPLLRERHRGALLGALRLSEDLARQLEPSQPRLVLREQRQHFGGCRIRAELRGPRERSDRDDVRPEVPPRTPPPELLEPLQLRQLRLGAEDLALRRVEAQVGGERLRAGRRRERGLGRAYSLFSEARLRSR